MRFDVQVSGLRELQETLLRTLPAKVQSRAVATALRKAAQPMVVAARAGYKARARSGSLAAATSVWRDRKSERRRGTSTFASVEIGARRSNRKALAKYYEFYGRKPTPAQLRLGIRHAHLIEWGTARGTPALRILTRAFDSHARAAVAAFGKELGAAIEKEAARRGRGRPR